MITCWNCNKEITEISRIIRETTCPFCHASQYCCKNCNFYEPEAHNQCREPAAEWVEDKEKANFCEYFIPNRKVKTLSWHKQISKEEAERRWQELVKKKKRE